MFKPMSDEILQGKVKSCSKEGVHGRCHFGIVTYSVSKNVIDSKVIFLCLISFFTHNIFTFQYLLGFSMT